MAKGVYDLNGMESSAKKIKSAMEEYKANKNKIIETVDKTKQYWEDPINTDYVNKFENLKQDMESVQNLMEAYAEYLTKAAKLIRTETTTQ